MIVLFSFLGILILFLVLALCYHLSIGLNNREYLDYNVRKRVVMLLVCHYSLRPVNIAELSEMIHTVTNIRYYFYITVKLMQMTCTEIQST